MSLNQLPSKFIEPPRTQLHISSSNLRRFDSPSERIRIQLFVVAFRCSISLPMEQKLIDAKRIVFLCAHEFQLLKYFGAIAVDFGREQEANCKKHNNLILVSCFAVVLECLKKCTKCM
jgi:hypothetical protein